MSIDELPGRNAAKQLPIWGWFAIVNAMVVVAACAVIWTFVRPATTKRDETGDGGPKSTAQRVPDSVPAASPTRLSTADIVSSTRRGIVLISTYNTNHDRIGYGTGFLIDARGLLATNLHVLRGASSADVEFDDHQKLAVKGVRGWDPASDLAIIELETAPLGATILPLSGDSEREIGAEVVTIGHPHEFRFSTTNGIISAIQKTADLPMQCRQALGLHKDQMWLQTNAVIASGSSGGPLLDHSGQVIGVSTWVSGGYSFCIDARHLRVLQNALRSDCRLLVDLTGPDEKLGSMLQEYQTTVHNYYTAFANARSAAQHQSMSQSTHPAATYSTKLYDMAVMYADAPVSFDCLQWLCRIAAATDAPNACAKSLEQAANRIVSMHINDPRLVSLIWELRYSPQPGAWQLMQQIYESTSDRDTRGIACYCGGQGRQCRGSAEDYDEAKNRLEQVQREFANVIYHCPNPAHPQHQIGPEADEALYRLKTLNVGRPAQEIVGPDSEGVAFRLGDYRGKIVLVVFWAEWREPGQKMMQIERTLVEDFKDQPFALLGVTRMTPAVRQLIDDRMVTWRNWVDGPEGSLATAWRIEGLPTIYVIDHQGIIRYRAVGGVPPEYLKSWIEDLIAKIPAAP